MKLIFLALALSVACAVDVPPSCHRPVYCGSKLLHYMQMANIFPNSKMFVDLYMKNDENVILSSFEHMLNETHNEPTKQQLENFVVNNFDVVDELENWTPPDFKQEPSFIYRIKDVKLRQFAKDINNIWPTLGRKVKSVVFEKPESFSLIPVHHGFMVPGERFKEFYYWDTYWIVEGLLASGMTDTVKGVISNLIEMQRQFGHVPSGSRYYYQERSQPPLLSAMMKLYIEVTHDVEFLKANIDALESELQYWLDTQTITFNKDAKEHTLLRYYAVSEGPRPEAYYEDFTLAQKFESEELKKQFYIDIKSAAESGWDFSSRWFITEDKLNVGNLTTLSTSHIIPVDLNAYFVNSVQNIAYFYGLLHNPHKSARWAHFAQNWRRSIQEVFWNEEDGIWYDWDLSNERPRKFFYPSNIAPLWMDVVDREFVKNKGPHIIEYMKKTQSLNFPGGVPTSLFRSGERWDFPNAYAPLVSMIVKSLEALHMDESKKMALDVVQSWVRSNYKAYVTSKKLLEKYNVEQPGKVENEDNYLLAGYAWTVGVVLQMLAKYDTLTVQEGYYDFYEYKKNPTFWHVPTSHYLPSKYTLASRKAAPVLTQPLSLFNLFKNLTSAPGQLENVPSVASYLDTHNLLFQSILPSSPVPLNDISTPHQSQYIVNSLAQEHIQPVNSIQTQSFSSSSIVPVKSEIVSVQSILPDHVPFAPIKSELTGTIPVKPELLPSKPIVPENIPVKPDHVEYSHSVQASIQNDPIVSVPHKPELLPLNPALQEYVPVESIKPGYVEYANSVQTSSTSGQLETSASVPIKPELLPHKPVLPEHVPAQPLQPDHVEYTHSVQASLLNDPIVSVPHKPELLPLKPALQEHSPVESIKPGYVEYGNSVQSSSTYGQLETGASVPIKPELLPSKPVLPEHVPVHPLKPDYVEYSHSLQGYIQKPEHYPLKPALQEHVPEPIKPGYVEYGQAVQTSASSGQLNSIASVPIQPELIPLKPVQQEHLSVEHTNHGQEYVQSVQTSSTSGQIDSIASVPIKPEPFPSTPDYTPVGPVKPGHVEYSHSVQTSVQNQPIISAPSKPEIVPLKPSVIVPFQPIKPGYVQYSQSVSVQTSSQNQPLSPQIPVLPAVPLDQLKPGHVEYTQSVQSPGLVPLKPTQHEQVEHSLSAQLGTSSAQIKPISGQTLPVPAKPEHIQIVTGQHQTGNVGLVNAQLAEENFNKDISVVKNQEIHFSGGSSHLPSAAVSTLSANKQQAQAGLAAFGESQAGLASSTISQGGLFASTPSQKSLSTSSLSISAPAQVGSFGFGSSQSAVSGPVLTGSAAYGTSQSASYSKSFSTSSNSGSSFSQTGQFKQTGFSV